MIRRRLVGDDGGEVGKAADRETLRKRRRRKRTE